MGQEGGRVVKEGVCGHGSGGDAGDVGKGGGWGGGEGGHGSNGGGVLARKRGVRRGREGCVAMG